MAQQTKYKSGNRRRDLRQLDSLRIRKISHLCRHLRLGENDLSEILQNLDTYYYSRSECKNGKVRELEIPTGLLKRTLRNLNALLQRLKFPECVHGGLKGHSCRTNAKAHIGKPSLLKADIKNFFPSITEGQVRRMFRVRLQCSADIAAILAKLTTYKNLVPQGSPTSTIVATLVTEHLSYRFAGLSGKHESAFTQYVDDMTISGPKHLPELKGLIARIIESEGFVCHPNKLRSVPRSDEQIVTGLRVNNGIDIPREKIRDARALIDDIGQRQVDGELIPEKEVNSLRGKIGWITQSNPGTGKFLSKQLNRTLKN
ncbi:MAG: RNA-directed DNA polymerase [Candidatus Hydrogenedentes bacterium]|nr:RNA-directed DNA polymerase [Candidatus Hydrogenedentota bacterium]